MLCTPDSEEVLAHNQSQAYQTPNPGALLEERHQDLVGEALSIHVRNVSSREQGGGGGGDFAGFGLWSVEGAQFRNR